VLAKAAASGGVVDPVIRAAHWREDAGDCDDVSVATHGTHHMRVIGQTGARVTIARHGHDFWRGLMDAQRWQTPR
jgi:hypothetical protein